MNNIAFTFKFIQPRKAFTNAYIERFNGIFRKDILDAYMFETLSQVRVLTENWTHYDPIEKPPCK